MRKTLINHPHLKMRMRTGSEGPRHDPYSYTEYTVETPNAEVLLHEGLAVFKEVNGERVSAKSGDYDAAHAFFDCDLVKHTGFTLAQLERISRNAKSRCRKGGYHDTYSESGYPGEEFEVCTKCGEVVDSYFNESAIL